MEDKEIKQMVDDVTLEVQEELEKLTTLSVIVEEWTMRLIDEKISMVKESYKKP